MKIRYLKLKNWLIMTAMGLFGLSACHNTKVVAQQPIAEPEKPIVQRPEIAVMYGVPTMDFVVKGQVRDTQGKPVEGIQVILVNQTVEISPESMQEDNPFVREYIRNASDTTDAEGNFQCQNRDVPIDQQHLIIRDIDGSQNGTFKDQMLEVNFTNDDQTRSGKGWYMGTRTKEITVTVDNDETSADK